jgi:hypothetical protein
MSRLLGFLLLASLLGTTACGGSSADSVHSAVTITTVSPASAPVGSANITITIIGSNFWGSGGVRSQVVWVLGSVQTPLATTFVGSSTLTAVISSTLLASVQQAQLFVENLDSAGAVQTSSPPVTFSVLAPALGPPVISSLSPATVPAGSADLTLTITGENFDGAGAIRDRVVWTFAGNDTVLSSTVDTVTQITSTIPAALLASSGNAGISVQHYDFVEGTVDATSSTAIFTITGPASSASFHQTGSMHIARSGHTATLLENGLVLIAGGGDGSAELYDPGSGTFSVTGPPVTPRLDATATLLADGRVLIAGGLGTTAPAGSHLPSLEAAEIFDPGTGTFSPTGNMLSPHWKHTATLLRDGNVLIAGGNGVHFCSVGVVELFDPATGIFSATGDLISPSGRVSHTATALDSGKVLIVGGSNGCAPDAADDPPWDPLFAELYDPAVGAFAEAGPMSTTRIGHVVIHLRGDDVLILGGIPALQNIHEQPPAPQYAELWSPIQQGFLARPGLTISQTGYTATLLPNGLVLVAGGMQAGQPASDALLLDTGTGSIASAGSLVQPRTGHTATLLKDGRVLVTGGTDANGNDLASAEIYQ